MLLIEAVQEAEQQGVGPGTWPDWIAATFTSLAFLIAAVSYAYAVKDRREAQARLVYSKFTHSTNHEPGETFELLPNDARMGNGGGATIVHPADGGRAQGLALVPLSHTTAVIHNGSKELIGPARIQMVNGGTGEVWNDFSISVGAVDPESTYVVDFTWQNTFYPGFPSLGTTVIFRDASGRWWRRHRSEPIEHVHADPENEGPPAAERVLIRRQQEGMGIPEESWIAEPKLSLRVRWHRLLRRLRGKHPIP